MFSGVHISRESPSGEEGNDEEDVALDIKEAEEEHLSGKNVHQNYE